MILASTVVGPSTDWYLTRATGIVALVLLSGNVALGVLDVSRVSSPRWPRFVVDGLHRTVALLSVAFLLAHILTSVLDSFAPIGPLDAVIPFHSRYRPLWLGLGAVAFDLTIAVVITSVARERLGYRTWRAVHWLAYASWPVALLHGLGSGSDTREHWLLAINAVCVLVVLGAVAARALQCWSVAPRAAAIGVAGAVAFAGGVLIWLPDGPLGHDWAKRAGTPTTLLAPRPATGVARR